MASNDNAINDAIRPLTNAPTNTTRVRSDGKPDALMTAPARVNVPATTSGAQSWRRTPLGAVSDPQGYGQAGTYVPGRDPSGYARQIPDWEAHRIPDGKDLLRSNYQRLWAEPSPHKAQLAKIIIPRWYGQTVLRREGGNRFVQAPLTPNPTQPMANNAAGDWRPITSVSASIDPSAIEILMTGLRRERGM